LFHKQTGNNCNCKTYIQNSYSDAMTPFFRMLKTDFEDDSWIKKIGSSFFGYLQYTIIYLIYKCTYFNYRYTYRYARYPDIFSTGIWFSIPRVSGIPSRIPLPCKYFPNNTFTLTWVLLKVFIGYSQYPGIHFLHWFWDPRCYIPLSFMIILSP